MASKRPTPRPTRPAGDAPKRHRSPSRNLRYTWLYFPEINTHFPTGSEEAHREIDAQMARWFFESGDLAWVELYLRNDLYALRETWVAAVLEKLRVSRDITSLKRLVTAYCDVGTGPGSKRVLEIINNDLERYALYLRHRKSRRRATDAQQDVLGELEDRGRARTDSTLKESLQIYNKYREFLGNDPVAATDEAFLEHLRVLYVTLRTFLEIPIWRFGPTLIPPIPVGRLERRKELRALEDALNAQTIEAFFSKVGF